MSKRIVGLFLFLSFILTFSCAFAATNQLPAVISIYPTSGTSAVNQQTIFIGTYSDPDGYQNIKYVYLLVTVSVSGNNCFYGYYNRQTNKLYLRDDANSLWVGGFTPGSNNVIENSYVKLNCKDTIVSGSSNNLSVQWAVVFKPTFTGAKNTYLYAKDNSNAISGWVQKGNWSVYTIAAKAFLTASQRTLLQGILSAHLNYFISPDTVSPSGLPLGGYKESDPGRFGYSNPTEWGYAMLAWMMAVETGKITKADAAVRINKALATMQSLQNNPAQNYQKLFYAYYHLLEPEGVHHDSNVEIPSIDNGYLYTSLYILEGWARNSGLSTIAERANKIRRSMKFRVFLFTDTVDGKLYMSHTVNAPTGQVNTLAKWNVYADEGGTMLWIAYLSGAINLDEYKALTNNTLRSLRSWKGITVEECPWFNAMFTWGVRSWAGFPVATWEVNSRNNYSKFSFAPAVKAHLAFGRYKGTYYPAFSDAMTMGLVGRYTPPNITNNIPADLPQHVVPHALFVPLCIGPDLEPGGLSELLGKISALKSDQAKYYHSGQDAHKPFGFELTVSPNRNDIAYAGTESRYIFETLSNAYIVMSIFQGLAIDAGKPSLFRYASQVPGYLAKVKPIVAFLYATPKTIKVPSQYATIQAAVNAANQGDTVEIAPGNYVENVSVIDKSKIILKGQIGDRINYLNYALNTVIDGNAETPLSLEKSGAAVIDSLVLTGVNKGYFGGAGAMVITDSDKVAVRDCIITENWASAGTGIYSPSGNSILIERNIFTRNRGHYSCAIHANPGTAFKEDAVMIISNEIANNAAWATAPAIYSVGGYIYIKRNLIYNNSSDFTGAILIQNIPGGSIENNIIIGNYSDYRGSGGGIYCSNSAISIINNVFYRNSAQAYMGSDIYIDGDQYVPVIKNNIFYGPDGAPGYSIYNDSPLSPEVAYNDVYGYLIGNYYGIAPGAGSISEPPEFVLPGDGTNPKNDDYHLKPISKCINAGDPAAAYNDKNGSRNDMGVYGGPGAL